MADEALGPYRLVRRLGGGGSANVYVGAHGDRPQQPVAIKVLRSERLRDSGQVLKFLDEARVGAQLSHPNLVPVIDFGRVGDRVFLVMPLLEGLTLTQLDDGRGLPVGAVVAIGEQIAQGLAHAHAARSRDGAPLRLIHRDIKPSNLFVTFDGVVKIIDFGIAHFDDEQRLDTRTGVFHGTLAYASPEQTRSVELDARSDLFSLGLVLHQLLTGTRVFHQSNDAAVVSALLFEPILPVRSRRPDVPTALDLAIQRVLERDPAARWDSAAAFAEALRDSIPADEIWTGEQLAQRVREQASRGLPAPGTATGTPPLAKLEAPRSPSRPRRRPLLTAAIGATLAAGLLVGGRLFLSRRPTTPPPAPLISVAPIVGAKPVVALPAQPEVSKPAPPPMPSEPEPVPVVVPKQPAHAHATRSHSRETTTSTPGWLSVDSRSGWAQVRIDGKDLGPTPVFHHPLTPGRHHLEAVRPDGVRRSQRLIVVAGHEQKLMLDWP